MLLFGVDCLPVLNTLPRTSMPAMSVAIRIAEMAPMIIALRLERFRADCDATFTMAGLAMFSFCCAGCPSIARRSSSAL